MPKMMLRSTGKPPLAARSPIRIRSRSKARPSAAGGSAVRSPPGSFTNTKLPNRNRDAERSQLRPEYYNISCELQALAKMVYQELGSKNDANYDADIPGAQRSPIFERGRFYDEYSARRNERLRTKKGETEVGSENKSVYDLGVRIKSAMKREASRYSSRGKIAAAAIAATPERVVQTSRYSLRSGARKENNKPPLHSMNLSDISVGKTQRKASVRRVRKV